jgi:hypothetical protein
MKDLRRMSPPPKRFADTWTSILLVGGAVPLGGCTDRILEAAFADTDASAQTDAFDDDGVDPSSADPSDTHPSDTQGDPSAGEPEPEPLPGRPQLVDVRFIDADSLQLTYSEPMAAPAQADPTAFRLSMALVYDYEGTQQETFYIDPTYYNGELYCGTSCSPGGCYDYCYGAPGPSVVAVGLSLDGTDARRIVLELDNPVSAGVCRTLDSFTTFGDSHGLFLHYTDDRPGVTDAAGEPALPLAEHWTLMPGKLYAYAGGSFPALDPLLPIPCPF